MHLRFAPQSNENKLFQFIDGIRGVLGNYPEANMGTLACLSL